MRIEVGSCVLHLADFRDVLPGISGATAIVADPPYGNNYRQKRSRDKLVRPDSVHAPIIGNAEPFDPRPLLGAAPVVVLWGANYYADKLPANGKCPRRAASIRGGGPTARNCTTSTHRAR